MKNLGFIGVGNMGMALLRGVLSSPLSKNIEFYAYDIDKSKKDILEPLGVRFLSDEISVTKTCGYIVIAAKPQQTDELFKKLKPHILNQVIISICAGISVKLMEKRISASAKIVQVMPNTPMMLGLGASAVTRNENVSDTEFEFAKGIIDSCGISEIIQPDKMNEIIAVNGSSPAFIYEYARCFTDYAKKQGIDEKAALRLFSQTLIGAGKMLLDSGMTPEKLTEQVCSKGGTTAAGLEALKNGLSDIVENTCNACTKRAYELSEDNFK